MVHFSDDLYLILLEYGQITYDEYVQNVSDIPPEYATVDLFYKNKGKALKRLKHDVLWRDKP